MTDEAAAQAAGANEIIIKAGKDGVILRIRSNSSILLSLTITLAALIIVVLYLPNAGVYAWKYLSGMPL